MIFRQQFAKSFAKIKYIELDKEMGLKSSMSTAHCCLGMSTTRGRLIRFIFSSPWWKSSTACITSTPTVTQLSRKKKTRRPSGPGAPSPFKPWMADRTSSSINGRTSACCCDAKSLVISRPDHRLRLQGPRLETAKKCRASASLTCAASETTMPPTQSWCKWFSRFSTDAASWKNLVLASHAWSHN